MSGDCGSEGRGFESRQSPPYLQEIHEASSFDRASFTTKILRSLSLKSRPSRRRAYCQCRVAHNADFLLPTSFVLQTAKR